MGRKQHIRVTPAETSDLVTVKIFSASDICNRTADNVQSMIHFGTMCAIEGRGGGGSPLLRFTTPPRVSQMADFSLLQNSDCRHR